MPFIRTLPDGIHTHVDRDGSNISFGQKQLISLARMVIRQPPVLLLDECTSALDPVTQEAVQKSIFRDFPRTTIIAVAHHLETILGFEQICVFHQGHVVEKGTVRELRSAGGAFAKMLQAKRMTKPRHDLKPPTA
ncbi:ABCB12 [Symbiodinium natans]|uniref:ABCB12 protein n=1 Tax=Symbiodinium natans TaxID=878477 RepID=A0A812Q4R7_9DINO|nr:ABCB12 [Symbiodinium natans]